MELASTHTHTRSSRLFFFHGAFSYLKESVGAQIQSGPLRGTCPRFRWGAKKVSLMAQWQQYAPFVAVAALLIFVLILKFYF